MKNLSSKRGLKPFLTANGVAKLIALSKIWPLGPFLTSDQCDQMLEQESCQNVSKISLTKKITF